MHREQSRRPDNKIKGIYPHYGNVYVRQKDANVDLQRTNQWLTRTKLPQEEAGGLIIPAQDQNFAQGYTIAISSKINRYGNPNATQGFIWKKIAWPPGRLERKKKTKSSLF